MPARAVVWRVAVTIGWVAAIVGLVLLDGDEGSWYIVVGPPLTVLVGAIVNRWWVLLAPLMVSVVWITIALLQPPCTDCSHEDPWQLIVYVTLLLFTLPAMGALGTGVGLRRIRKADPRLPRGNQHA